MPRRYQFPVLLLISLISIPIAVSGEYTGEEPCPPGWEMNTKNYHCYFIGDSEVTYPIATDRCLAMNAQLTTDDNMDERKFLKELLIRSKRKCLPGKPRCNDFWMGLHMFTRYWTWPDGTVATSSNWYPGFPTPNSKCGLISVDTVIVAWKNEQCSTKLKFICKANCPNAFVYSPKAKSCYRIIRDKFSWDESLQQCNSLSPPASLAIIDEAYQIDGMSEYIDDLIKKEPSLCYSHMFGADFWIGGKRSNSDECKNSYLWRTYNGSVLMEFANWNDGEPNCDVSGEMCVHVGHANGDKWAEGYCTASRCPLCHLKLESAW